MQGISTKQHPFKLQFVLKQFFQNSVGKKVGVRKTFCMPSVLCFVKQKFELKNFQCITKDFQRSSKKQKMLGVRKIFTLRVNRAKGFSVYFKPRLRSWTAATFSTIRGLLSFDTTKITASSSIWIFKIIVFTAENLCCLKIQVLQLKHGALYHHVLRFGLKLFYISIPVSKC